MKVLVTGSDGLLGAYLLDALNVVGDIVPCPRSRCDLGAPNAVVDVLEAIRPEAIVHAAAYTDVDGCERDPARAVRYATATDNLVAACPETTQIVFTSTDQVYADTSGPHSEAEVGPVNEYGRTKLLAERAVLEHPRGLVLRCNFFAESRTVGRSSLSDVIVRSLREGRTFTGFTDSIFTPLHARTLSGEIAESVAARLRGVFNIGSTNGASKADFARLVARHYGLDEHLIEDLLSTEIAGRVPRPRDLRMDVGRYITATGRTLPTLEREVALL